MKRCTKCKEEKSKENFYRQGKTRDGYRTVCIKCWSDMCKKNDKKYQRKPNQKAKKIKEKYGLGVGTISRYGFKLALEVYEKFNRKCAECGEKNDLTLHHLDRKGRNYENAGLKPNNSIENLSVLCRRCHGSLHGKQGGRKKSSL